MRRVMLLLAAMTTVGLLGTADGLLSERQRADAQTVSRPNIVFVMTDDLDERSMKRLVGIRDVMGSNGTTFNKAYVSYSLCCPSRVTFFRGQYAHNHGIISGTNRLGEPRFRQLGLGESTVATWLNDDGYQTKYLGKYINGYKGPYIPPGWDEWFAFTGAAANHEVNDDGQTVQLTGNTSSACD